MSSPTAIGDVSASLRDLLIDQMSLDKEVAVTILGPNETGAACRINLFLYQVQESPTLKNFEWQVKRGDSSQVVPPPLSLHLFYLMTPYDQNDQQTGNAAQHEILGDAMRVFYENPVVPAANLEPGLSDAREEIRIMLRALDLDELSRVWATFTEPFRLSVLYEVSVVQLDQLAGERTMARRVETVGVPQVRAPYRPPRVTGLAPAAGPAETAVTVRGTDLEGWQPYVTISGRRVLPLADQPVDERKIRGRSFQFTVPAGLEAGFHEVRIDVSHLHRTTFFFQVTSP